MSMFIENVFASQQGCITLLKSDSKDFNIITKKSKLSIQRMLKCIKVSTKILSSTPVYNPGNSKKHFLNSKSAY